MSGTDHLRATLVLASCLAFSRTAHADAPPARVSSPDAAAAAEKLFLEGRLLVADGRTADGCSKLEESERLDPAPGTQMNLADCYAKSGRTASAWMAFHEAVAAAQRAGRPEWAEQARARAQALAPSVPELTIVVDEPAPGLRLRRGALPVEATTFGVPVPVDPGTYEIAATAPGRRPWTTRVPVDTGQHVILHVPPLFADPPLAPAPAARSGAPTRVPRSTPPVTPSTGSVQRTAALVLGAVALLPLGAGALLGLTAIADNDDAAARCPTSPRCTDPRAVELTDDARRAANASTAAFVTAGTVLATASILFFTAPRAPLRASVGVGPLGPEVGLTGRW